MALIKSNLKGNGGSYETWTPSGQNLATAATNATIGKYYIIGYSKYGDSHDTPVGCTIIAEAKVSASQEVYAALVEATATTIGYGAAGYNACYAVPLELTL